jgi:hypothetical protein
MSNKKRRDSKNMLPNGRSASGGFWFRAVHAIYDHPNYIDMKPTARALLWDLCRQYNQRNNGDLTLAPKIMKKWGWNKSTIDRHKQTLIDNEWIFIAGHKKARNGFVYLYALTWLEINSEEIGDKLYEDAKKHKPKSLRF